MMDNINDIVPFDYVISFMFNINVNSKKELQKCIYLTAHFAIMMTTVRLRTW